ncbi:sulfite exporter TauE/SafE family protein [Candidatus Saganbacteria bacterium]|nr:sulfite exporter TauE/SafE family protein [Candidatus Saganbacteria bacterium]
MNLLSLGVAFLGGLVSFLSPCVLPLIPGFLAYLAGTSLSEAQSKKREIFLNSLFFVLGFSAVFSLLGVLLNSILEGAAFEILVWLSRVGGIIIIFFGIYLMGFIKIPFLEKEYKLTVKTKFKSRYLSSFVFGSAFAVGWTPCVGAVLGGILALAATQPGVAFSLLFSYSLGLGIPFLIVGLFAAPAAELIKRYSKWVKYVNFVFGLLLIWLGFLVFTQSLSRIANFELLNRLLLK